MTTRNIKTYPRLRKVQELYLCQVPGLQVKNSIHRFGKCFGQFPLLVATIVPDVISLINGYRVPER